MGGPAPAAPLAAAAAWPSVGGGVPGPVTGGVARGGVVPGRGPGPAPLGLEPQDWMLARAVVNVWAAAVAWRTEGGGEGVGSVRSGYWGCRLAAPHAVCAVHDGLECRPAAAACISESEGQATSRRMLTPCLSPAGHAPLLCWWPFRPPERWLTRRPWRRLWPSLHGARRARRALSIVCGRMYVQPAAAEATTQECTIAYTAAGLCALLPSNEMSSPPVTAATARLRLMLSALAAAVEEAQAQVAWASAVAAALATASATCGPG